MRETRGVSLETATEQAWMSFRRRLADRLSELDAGAVVLVEVEGDHVADVDGCTPYVQAFLDEEGVGLIAEVSANVFLHPQHRIGKEQRRQLRELGWLKPQKGAERRNHGVLVDPSRADEVAVMMVRALREVFGVVHPAFLVGECEEEDSTTADVVASDERLAVQPEDKDDLERLVEEALTPLFGCAPSRDSDGDMAVVSATAVVFVRVLPDRPIVHLFAELAVEVTEHERARFEVDVLNRDRRFAKFLLVDDVVQTHVYLPAAPFVPEHLRAALAMMCELADEVDDDLAVRVGGRRFLDPSESAPGEVEA
jgi:hypothetical protein